MGALETLKRLKGVHFLSPRDEKVIRILREEYKIPEEVIEEGLEECLKGVNPLKRKKYPAYRCIKKVLELYKLKKRKERKELNWLKRFKEKLSLVEDIINVSEVPKPSSEEEAERILREVEGRIFKRLWESLEKEEKKRIVYKLRDVREEDEELFKELVKDELRKRFGIPYLSLYIE
ncbi:hypothetical protein JCM9492_00510 [Aquifex pyrophilus]